MPRIYSQHLLTQSDRVIAPTGLLGGKGTFEDHQQDLRVLPASRADLLDPFDDGRLSRVEFEQLFVAGYREIDLSLLFVEPAKALVGEEVVVAQGYGLLERLFGFADLTELRQPHRQIVMVLR